MRSHPARRAREGTRHVSPSEPHRPVLREEVVDFLAGPAARLIDATVGDGGHASALLAASGPDGRLLGIDLDPDALDVASRALGQFGERARVLHGSFAEIDQLARAAGFEAVTGILFDLGLRSAQIDAPRGFSFRSDAPLDMRFDPTGRVALPLPEHPALRRLAREQGAYRAADVLRRLSESELADLFSTYADEPHAGRIARSIVTARRRQPIGTAGDLARLVVASLPPTARHRRAHAATRVFQALRIAVNREFESLRAGIRGALELLAPHGRLAVIAYHSGEDRIVKRLFREAAAAGAWSLLTKHPLVPSAAERATNPRSRSAKLRVLERHSHV